MVICAAYGCQYISDRGKGKGKGIPPVPISNTQIKQLNDLAATWLFKIGTGWIANYYTFSSSQEVGHEH